LSGRSGALPLLSPLRTERASFQALGSSIITHSDSGSCDGSINEAKEDY